MRPKEHIQSTDLVFRWKFSTCCTGEIIPCEVPHLHLYLIHNGGGTLQGLCLPICKSSPNGPDPQPSEFHEKISIDLGSLWTWLVTSSSFFLICELPVAFEGSSEW